MPRIGILFPGQGAQFVGMGRRMSTDFDVSRQVFERADDALGESLSDMCWSGPENALTLTENAQPAILATSIALLAPLRHYGISPVATAGLSLGEYAALVCAGSLGFEDAVRLVRKRGLIMQQAVPLGVGLMAAIMGLSEELVERACELARGAGVVEAANYNCPGQIVISGQSAAVTEAMARAKELGAKRVVALNVSAPFHCSLMEPAAQRFAEELERVEVGHAQVPVVANATSDEVRTPEAIRSGLQLQMARPVLWEQSVRKMVADGIDLFLEVGPGKSLAGFVKKIAPEIKCLNFDSRESLEVVVESAGVGC